MSRLADMSPAERFEHGTRSRYTSGCRCDRCREANRLYKRSRIGQPPNPLVSTAAARAHLLELSAKGVGRRAVAAACDVGLTVVMDIRSGKKPLARARTVERILAVDGGAIADNAHVPARETWRVVRELQEMGMAKVHIARELGYSGPGLQLGRRFVTARNAMAVEKLLRRVQAETPEGTDDLCTGCGHSHAPENRARLIRAMVVARESSPAEVAAEFPCFYPDYGTSSASQQRLFRDARAARGERRERGAA